MGFLGSRNTIIVLTVITAVVHLVILNLGGLQPLFALNGIGYLALLWALFWPPSFLKGQSALVHYAFIAYTVLTIVMYFAQPSAGGFTNPLGVVTKIDELLLAIGLYAHMRS